MAWMFGGFGRAEGAHLTVALRMVAGQGLLIVKRRRRKSLLVLFFRKEHICAFFS
jgi:hypothetical protein